MGRKGHARQEIDTVLRKSVEGVPVEKICQEHGISIRTLYRWKAGKAGFTTANGRVVKDIEEENQQLKNVLAELMLENRALKEELARGGRVLSAR